VLLSSAAERVYARSVGDNRDVRDRQPTASCVVETPFGRLGVVASGAGVRRVRLPGAAVVEAAGGPGAAAIAGRAAAQLAEYLGGERQVFDLPLDWRGVDDRHRHVLEVLREAAPYGRTITYGELGRRAGEGDPREVGVLVARNPIPLVVPCHRVVAADGPGGYGGGLELKQRLLELEHVLPARLPLA
jgi:methylated-DNA-[protein]-cysteine S-methyltransferase